MSAPRMPNAPGPIKIFISHGHDDRVVAGQLIDFLLTEFDLKPHEIRCTSGTEAANGLEPGESVAGQLRKDLNQTKLVIGLLSYFGLDSVWVKFELGAAWGKKKKMIPIVGPDLKGEFKRLGPLGADFHLSVEDHSFETTLLSHSHQKMEKLGIAVKNSPLSKAKLNLFAETYRQYGGLKADFSAIKFRVISPEPGDTVGGDIVVKFEVENIPENGFLWFGVMPRGKEWMFWPKEVNDRKEQTVVFQQGGTLAPGAMTIGVIGVGIAGNAFIKNWLERGHAGKGFPGLSFSDEIHDARKIPGVHELCFVENLTLKNP